jgi:hypothetical protein
MATSPNGEIEQMGEQSQQAEVSGRWSPVTSH